MQLIENRLIVVKLTLHILVKQLLLVILICEVHESTPFVLELNRLLSEIEHLLINHEESAYVMEEQFMNATKGLILLLQN